MGAGNPNLYYKLINPMRTVRSCTCNVPSSFLCP